MVVCSTNSARRRGRFVAPRGGLTNWMGVNMRRTIADRWPLPVWTYCRPRENHRLGSALNSTCIIRLRGGQRSRNARNGDTTGVLAYTPKTWTALTSASRKWALSTHRGQRLDPLSEPGELRVGKPELGEVPHGAGEIVAVGAAAAGGARNDPRGLVQRQPPGVVRMIAPYREGKRPHAAAGRLHRQAPHGG